MAACADSDHVLDKLTWMHSTALFPTGFSTIRPTAAASVTSKRAKEPG
jgi:hypothetical protein